MDDQTTLAQPPTLRLPRTVALLIDTLQTSPGGVFEPGSEGLFLLRLASLLASASGGRVLLGSVIAVPEGESISAFSVKAQAMRQKLTTEALAALSLTTGTRRADNGGEEVSGSHSGSLITPVVRVAREDKVPGELRELVTGESNLLLLLPLRHDASLMHRWLRKALRSPLPCDVAWARPPLTEYRSEAPTAPFTTGMRVLLPARGGPQAMLGLDLAHDLTHVLRAQVNLLHVVQDMPERMRASEEAPFDELLSSIAGDHQLGMPRRVFAQAGDLVRSISEVAGDYDLLVMGAGGKAAADVGRFTEQVARNTEAAVIAVKSRVPVGPAIRAARKRARPYSIDPETLSLVVDKWFAENTFDAGEFSDLHRLVDIKRQRGCTISVGLPALDEEATIGGVITTLRDALMRDVPLIDEIVVIDSNSTDRTREIAEELGVPVYVHQRVLPEAGPPLTGKGEALWKSLHVLKGDIIAWCDTDVEDIHPQFVYGLVGPLLREPRIGFVKGYYHRPILVGGDLQHEGGGRVTELTVRPLLNLFFPLLSGVVQPLAGEYAGRREVLEQLPFFSGYGVETGMLIDLLDHFGLYSIGQVNLQRRVHRNRTLADLSLTAFAIVQVILTRLEGRARISLLEEVNQSMKLIRFEQDHLSLEVRRVRDVERPPIITVTAYRAAHGEQQEG